MPPATALAAMSRSGNPPGRQRARLVAAKLERNYPDAQPS